MQWQFKTPEGDVSTVYPAEGTAKAEAVRFYWTRAFVDAGMHAAFGPLMPDDVNPVFAELEAEGWSVFEGGADGKPC